MNHLDPMTSHPRRILHFSKLMFISMVLVLLIALNNHQIHSLTFVPKLKLTPIRLCDALSRPGSSLFMASSSYPSAVATNKDSMPSIPECEALLATAEQAARAAGTIIVSNLGCCSEQDCEVKYSIKDVVTQYDQQAQVAIHSIVSTAYPTHNFLGEEDVAAGGAASAAALSEALRNSPEYLWICDPIDGTANFASGLPLCGVTMTVLYQGSPVVAAIYDPHRDEMFSTIRGQGAWLTTNGDPSTKESLAVQSTISSVSAAIVNAGCPADPNAFQASMRGVLALNNQARGIRVLACSALTLAWIASGRLTAHFGYDLSSWDLVAGAMLIQEAGGHISDLNGSPYSVETRNMLCSNNPEVHTQILTVLNGADAVSFERS